MQRLLIPKPSLLLLLLFPLMQLLLIIVSSLHAFLLSPLGPNATLVNYCVGTPRSFVVATNASFGNGGTVEPLLYDHPQNHIVVVV